MRYNKRSLFLHTIWVWRLPSAVPPTLHYRQYGDGSHISHRSLRSSDLRNTSLDHSHYFEKVRFRHRGQKANKWSPLLSLLTVESLAMCSLWSQPHFFFSLQLHQLKHLKSSRQDEAGLLAHPSKSTEAYSSLCPGRCLISWVSAASFLLKSRSSTKLLAHLAQSHFVVSMTRESVSGNASLIINAMQWFSNLATCYNYFKCF